ncbi:alpha/beta hydrolase [Caenispirillum salinarum]|uniref:alpha/beta hydrolase n=1 Tax=Caenispirillum salinarum TaxID=859058 RepID=UPI0038505FB3
MAWLRRLLVAGGFLAALAVAGAVLMWRLEDHDLGHRQSEAFSVATPDGRLAGSLWLPDGPPRAAVALVHGDGPQDRTASGGYAQLINTLLDAGLAVVAWDKPGTGGSAGNWLDQSMDDRAAETRAALAALRRRIAPVPVGALGFSQAGWVLPKLRQEDAAFLVLAGPAVSWQDQGRYYTRTRLERQGMAPDRIEAELDRLAREDDRLFGPAHVDPAALPDGLDPDRRAFIRRNRTADATDDLRRLRLPLLALWGANDLNVDAAGAARVYRDTAAGNHPANRIVTVPGATHGLLKADRYNTQLVSQWPWYTLGAFLLEGRRAYAPGTLDTILDWILARAEARASSDG